MFQDYQSYSPETESYEIARADHAVQIAVSRGVEREFAIAYINAGHIDFHLATAEYGAYTIVQEWRSRV